jgi:murein DD-endopeptidase MepM/ murein hydrolase activator NlpD
VTQEYSGPTFYSNHTGIDLGSKGSVIGGRVEAVRNGTVIRAGWDTTGYGNLVVVDHGDGLKSYYSHLNSISVGVGQQVNINTQVGTLGTTGNSTGPHLHLEVRLNNVPQNPRNYISGL